MRRFLGIDKWSQPQLVVSSKLWESTQIGVGFLTPTPFLLPSGLLRVFGGVRDTSGRSVICWADLEPLTLRLADFSRSPCFDTRESSDFDTDGAILGDVLYSEGILRMIYVGFRKSKEVKFQAFTGIATSTDFGISWTKQVSPFFKFHPTTHLTDIFAVHSMTNSNNILEHFVAIGNGWETINEIRYPKYETYSLAGKSLETLELSSVPIISISKEVYRLGRPRYFFSKSNQKEYLIATGGKRNGDYRPYTFTRIQNKWVNTGEPFVIEPGYLSGFMKQVCFPSVIEYDDRRITFFNGDEMGRAGCYAIQASIFQDSK